MRQERSEHLRGEWVDINIDQQAVISKLATRLPATGDIKNEFTVAHSRSMLETKLEPSDSIIIHTADMIQDNSSISATYVVIVLIFWIMIPLLGCYFTLKKFRREEDIIVVSNASAALLENGDVLSFTDANSGNTEEEVLIRTDETATSAMVCTLEHIAPPTKISGTINQKVGGLGKVMEVVARFHPGPLVMVTPMVGSESYPAMREAEPIDCMIDGQMESVRIFHYLWPVSNSHHKVESIFCKHDGIFGARSIKDEDLYPNDEKNLDYFLRFFALWSQTVAKLVLRHREELDVLHLCDYHTAFAPAYIKYFGGSIPTLCTLHNASYQGSLAKHILEECPLNHISSIMGLSREEIIKNFTLDGDFNMLSGLISYFRKYQNGHGFCAVSNNYAEEVPFLLENFRVGQVHVQSLPNPELKNNRPSSLYHINNFEELRVIKKQKKKELQEALGLNVDPDAMIAAFVGRLVVQKGVDAIADIATEMLLKHEKLQLIVIGPVGDVFGRYTSCRFDHLTRNEKFKNRIFFTPKFFRFTPDYRLGCDFALMPSRFEPFGFVDIEFAWAGCPCVGSLVGGLGKVPGWYFKIWKGAEFKHMRIQLGRTIDKVMEEGHEKVLALGAEAICTSFPVINWQKKLDALYQNVIKSSKPSSVGIATNILGEKNKLWALSENADLFLVKRDKCIDEMKSHTTSTCSLTNSDTSLTNSVSSQTNSVCSQSEAFEQNMSTCEPSNWKQKLSVFYHNLKRSGKPSCMGITTDYLDIPEDADLFLAGHGKVEDEIVGTISCTSASSVNSMTNSFSTQSKDWEQKHRGEAYDYGKSGVKCIFTEVDTFKEPNSRTRFKKISSYGSLDLEMGSQKKKSLYDILGEEMEENISQKMLTGKKINIKSVFKSVVWAKSKLTMNLSLSSARNKMARPCEDLLNKEIAERSVESWIVALLSIMMPGYSTVLYAKSIEWATAHNWDDNQIAVIYAAHFAAFAVACLLWPQILRRFSIGLCVSASSLLHVVSILYFTYAADSGYRTAVLISAAMGLISSANGPVFTAAMFFDELDGSLVAKMRNFGSIEGCKTIFTGFLQGIIVYDLLTVPSEGKHSVSLASSSSLLIIYGIIAALTVIGSILLFLGMSRNMRTSYLPKVKLSSVFSFKAFCWLSLSSILEGIISYPTLFLLSWLLLDGFSPEETGTWIAKSSVFTGFAIFSFTVLFTKFHEAPKCVSALVTLFANPVPLQAIVMMAAPNMSVQIVLVLLCITSFLIKLREGLVSVMKLHVLHSRWKVVTFSCYELFLTNIISAASPFVIRRIANDMGLSLNAVGPGASSEAAAAAIFYIVSPIAIISLMFQLMANQYAFLDISDIYTKVGFTKKK